MQGHTEIASLLIGAGANLDLKNQHGFEDTALIMSAYMGRTEIARLLVAADASLDLVNAS